MVTQNLHLFLSDVDFTCVIPSKKPTFCGPHKAINNRPNILLEEIDQGLRRSQAAAFAEGTLSNLTTQWVKYLNFCLTFNFNPLPADKFTLCRYAQYLSTCLKAHESVLNYISGVKTLHLLLNLPVCAFEHFLVKISLRGMHRLNTHTPSPAPPLSLPVLNDIHKLLDFSKEEDVIFWAVILVGFFLLLRKCNLVPDSGSTFDPDRQLKRSDIEYFQDHAKVTLRWTKNHQFGNKPLRFALPCIPDSHLCPVSAVIHVTKLVDGAPNDSVFKKSNGMTYSYNNLQTKLAWVSKTIRSQR